MIGPRRAGDGAVSMQAHSNTTLEACGTVWSCLYLEVVEIMHDLIVVHVQVVEAEWVRGGVAHGGLLAAREHRVAHYRGALHLRRIAPWNTQAGYFTAFNMTIGSVWE